MGLCVSKSSARSSNRSEKSEKCRWDKHGNVFFPVRRHSQPIGDNDAAVPKAFMKRNSFATTNPVYADFESPSQSKSSHFSSFSKLLKGSKAATLQCSRSRRAAYRDLLATKGFCAGQQSVEEGKDPSINCNHMKRPATLIKLVEAENNANATLSRSSSAKEASEYSFTRSSSAKEAALSRCSSQKEGKRDFTGEPGAIKARPSPEHLAAIACLKPRTQRAAVDGHAPENGLQQELMVLSKCQSKEASSQVQGNGSKVENLLTKDSAAAAIANNTVEAVVKSHAADRKDAFLKQSSAKDALPVNSSFLTRGLGLPSYQPLIFRAGSPDKCRERFSSTHSSLSSEDLAASATAIGAHARRRRSPNKMSPSRRSPSKRSPNKRVGGNDSSAARPQSRKTENLHPHYSIDAFKTQMPRSAQPIKSSTAKNSTDQANRSVLKELPRNDMKLHEQVGRQPSTMKVSQVPAGLPPKSRERQPGPVTVSSSQNCSSSRSEKFSVYSDEIHLDIQSSSSSEAITTEDELEHLGGKENSAFLMKGEPRSGSKRLRSPKKLTPPGEHKVTKEYLNFNLSFPASTVLEVKSKRNTDGSVANVSCERIPSEDKHIDSETNEANRDKEADQHLSSDDLSPPTEPDLLELLERTPKKLRKMALKLALMIELEHSQEHDDTVCELGIDNPTSDQAKQVKTNEKVGNSSDVDLELKLGMPNEKNAGKHGDGLRLDFSLALDSPGRAGSNSVPMTPRRSVSSICNGLSVEARIGSSKGLSSSDFSFHILKNPDKLFGSIPRFHITRTEQTEQTGESNMASSTFHVETCGNKVAVDMAAVEATYEDKNRAPCTRNEDSANTASGSNRSEVASEPTSQVQRCSSFGFEHDDPTPHLDLNGEVGKISADGNDFLYDGEDSMLTTPTKDHVQMAWEKRRLDLNKDARLDDEASPSFQFQVRSAMKSSQATPTMPTAAPVAKKHEETDALSLSADEIAEIWGAFEAGQESCTK